MTDNINNMSTSGSQDKVDQGSSVSKGTLVVLLSVTEEQLTSLLNVLKGTLTVELASDNNTLEIQSKVAGRLAACSQRQLISPDL
jgi:hypothetical protein